MGFAEQLAARAAETQELHQTSSGRRRRLTPPRPGKIHRGGGRATLNGPATGVVGGGDGRSSSSPSTTFADQLKQRRTTTSSRRERHTVSTSATSTGTPTKSFADQISERSSVASSPANSSPCSSVASSPANSIRHIKPKILLPSPGGGGDESDDEYASVGFSLMDASTVSSVGDNGASDNKQGEGGLVKQKSRKIKPPTKRDASTWEGHARQTDGQKENYTIEPSSPPRPKREAPTPPAFPTNNLSPIKDVIDPIQVHKKSQTFPRQEANNSELQSKLREQLIKSQGYNSRLGHSEFHNEDRLRAEGDNVHTCENEKHVDKSTLREHDNNKNEGRDGEHSRNSIFGAWAQIESLKRRVQEAESRALQESQRAEIVSYELRMVKEQHQQSEPHQNEGRSISQSVGKEDHGADSVSGSSLVTVTNSEAGASNSVLREDATPPAATVNTHEREARNGTATSSIIFQSQAVVPNAPQGETVSNALPSTSCDATQEDIKAALLWKKRALEAEERLAKEVERLERAAAAKATVAPQTAPPNHDNSQPQAPLSANSTITTAMTAPTSRLEESDIIRLKNAEIDVLRHQIHRLERRIQEECERNEDLLRSSYHHLDPLHGDAHPPLVVASECMTTSTRHTSDMDEFRLLRNEIRHLQYQLRTKSSGTMAHGATTTSTGESTLSSLDGNENNYNNENDEAEEEDDDDGNAVRGSTSSWGLCCIRGSRSRRGYGRV